MARVCVHLPFHRLEVPLASVYMYDPAWWAHRADILERYTLASLANQTDQDFDTVATFRDYDFKEDNPVVRVCRKHGVQVLVRPYKEWEYPVAPNHHDWFCKRYGTAHWLILLHLDTDDCYTSDAIALLRRQEPQKGALWWFGYGWKYGDKDQRMCWFGSRTGPPPFWAEVYPRSAMSGAKAFREYRKRNRFECYHHQVVRAPGQRRMLDGKILQVQHGKNSSSTWSNPFVKRRIRYWVNDPAEKQRILSLFGVRRDG